MKRKLMAMVAAGTLVAVGAGPAYAAGPGPAKRPAVKPRTDLTVSYMAEAGYAAAVTLTCEPAGGAHPSAAKACAMLKKSGADPSRIKPAPVMCTLEYAPIRAEVNGTWRGRTIAWSQRYSNSCDMSRATGVLFAF